MSDSLFNEILLTALELALLRPTVLIGDFFTARLFVGRGDLAAAGLACFVAAGALAGFFAGTDFFVVAFVDLVSSFDGLVVFLGEELAAILCFDCFAGLFEWIASWAAALTLMRPLVIDRDGD